MWPLAGRPLLVLCLCFLVGIWLAHGSGLPLLCWGLLGLGGVAAGLAWHEGRLTPLGPCLGALACGALLHGLQTLPRRDDLRLFVAGGDSVTIQGFVMAELPQASDLRRFQVAARQLETPADPREVSGDVLVYGRPVEEHLEGEAVRCSGVCLGPGGASNPAQLDYAASLARRHVSAVLKAASIARIASASAPLAVRVERAAAGLRLAVFGRLNDSMPGANRALYAALVGSIVWGMQVTPVPEGVAELFRRTGTIHLLVVSGAQVTWLAGAVLFLPRRRWAAARWAHALLVAVPLIFFALMVGLGPSVSRAIALCVLSILAGVGRVRHYDYDSYVALGVAAALICAFDPSALFSIGAQLSFAATLGVICALRWLGGPPAGRLGRVRHGLARLAAAAAGAWLMTTPLLAYCFQAIPVVGSLANLVVVPLAAAVMACAVIAIPVSLVSHGLALLVGYAARTLVVGMLLTNGFFGQLPLAYVPLARFPAWGCAAWYGVLGLGVMLARGRFRDELTPKRLLAAGLAVALVLSLWFAATSYRHSSLEVTFLDVGHGLCCVVRSPSGRTMMVDAGSGYSQADGERCARDIILPFLASKRIERLDVVVMSHPDADHCNALPEVLDQMPTGLVLEGQSAPTEATYARVAEVAQRRRIPVRQTWAEGRIDLGEGVRADVLWPTGTLSDEALSRNNRCVVLQVRYGRTSVLLPADIEEEAQRELVRRGAPLAAQVLQAPHHGGKHAMNRDFLRAVSPQWAVISCPAGDPEHPHLATLRKLQDANVQIERTDHDGAVTILSNGLVVRLQSHLRRTAQNRSPAWPAALTSASITASGSRAADSWASAVSFPLTVPSICRASRCRTSGVSSNRRDRNRRNAASSSPVSWTAAVLTSACRSSGGGRDEGSSAGAATSGSSLDRSLTTTVPAARSPSRRVCG